jgi:hypothetical protein
MLEFEKIRNGPEDIPHGPGVSPFIERSLLTFLYLRLSAAQANQRRMDVLIAKR